MWKNYEKLSHGLLCQDRLPSDKILKITTIQGLRFLQNIIFKFSCQTIIVVSALDIRMVVENVLYFVIRRFFSISSRRR